MAKTVRFDVLAVAKAEGFDEANRKLERLSGTAKKSTSGLLLAAAAFAPALIPIAAASTGLLGVAAAGGIAVLAVKGIQKEMKAGTPVGEQFSAAVGTLKGNLSELEHTAAGGVLGGFKSAVASLQPLMPGLNREVGLFSTQLGQIGGNVGLTLVNLFRSFEPLFLQVNADLVRGSAALERWAASSGGVSKFVAYAQNQLPQVEQTLGQLAVAVARIVAGLAPLGTVSLGTLGVLARVINLIPVSTMRTIAPAIAGIVFAYKGLSKAAELPGLKKLGLGFGTLGPIAAAAGIALGLYTTILGESQAKQAQATSEVNSYTDALKASHGAIDQSIRDQAAKNLQDSGALDAARKLGVGLDVATSAALGNAAAQSKIVAAGTALGLNLTSTGQLLGDNSTNANDLAVAYGVLFAATGTQNKELQKSIGAYKNQAEAVSGVGAAQAQASVTIGGVTTKIDEQTTASGLLKTALDKLNGVSLTVEQTENNFLDTLGNLKKAHDAGTASIAQNSAKGRVNREVLVSAIVAANDAAQATADQTAKTKGLTAGLQAGRTSLLAHEAAIRRAAAAAGLDKGQVDDLIRSLGKVPKQITSNVNVLTAAAKKKIDDLARYVSGLHPVMEVVAHTSLSAGHGKLAIRDSGGPVTAGTPYLIGLNRRPEVFIPGASGQIRPIAQSAPAMSSAGGDTYVTINVLNGDPRATVRALEQWAGRGGKIRIAAAVTE